MKEQQIEAVTQWHEALNTGNKEQLKNLVTEDICMIGPKGTAAGLQALTDWISKSGVSLHLITLYYKTDCIIAEQDATWNSVIDDDIQPVATVFKFRENKISSIQRYIHIQEALMAEGME